jgi:beta-lactamase superfamily II metal-dependent hydrolase
VSLITKLLTASHSFEITFFAVGNISKGGDAILIRWAPPSRREQYVLIDGGYKGDFPAIRGYLPRHIDHVICSHLDQDHISGLIELLKDKSKNIGALWLTCPESLITDDVLLAPHSTPRRFIVEAAKSDARFFTLQESLRQGQDLVRLATGRAIHIKTIHQGMSIGPLRVLSPSANLRNKLEPGREVTEAANRISIDGSGKARQAALALLEAAVSVSNEMSTVLWTDFEGKFPGGFLFTSDGGPKALDTALEAGSNLRIDLAKLGAYQLPHHGSIANFPINYRGRIKAPLVFVSAPPKSQVHPSEKLIFNLIQRGAKVFKTQGSSLRICNQKLEVKRLEFTIEFEQHGVFVYRISDR